MRKQKIKRIGRKIRNCIRNSKILTTIANNNIIMIIWYITVVRTTVLMCWGPY